MYSYDNISQSSSYNEKCFRHFVQKIKTHVLCSINFFRKSCILWDKVEEFITVQQATDDNTTRRMRIGKGKGNYTLLQALRLCTGRTVHRGSRGIALPFLYHGTRRGWGVSVTPRPLFTPGKDPVPIVQEAGWAPGLVWAGAGNLDPTGIRSSPDRPAHNQSLYRLRYPAHACALRAG